jgi:hypothetical protein
MQLHNIETIAWSGKFMWTNSAGHSLRISCKSEEESTALFFACLKSQSTSPELLTGAVSGGIFAFGCKVRWLQAPGIHCGVKNLTSTLRSSLWRCVTVFDLCTQMQFSKVVILSFLWVQNRSFTAYISLIFLEAASFLTWQKIATRQETIYWIHVVSHRGMHLWIIHTLAQTVCCCQRFESDTGQVEQAQNV